MSILAGSVKDLRVGNNIYINKLKKLSKRICVIYGLNGAGKDSIKDKLVESGNFIYNIKTTSREIKKNEISDVDYHFVNRNSPDFEKLRERAVVSYSFLSSYYWDDAKEIYNNLINNPDKYLIVIMGNIIGLKAFLSQLPNVNKFCILPTNKDSDLITESRDRMVSRDRDSLNLIEKRLESTLLSVGELKKEADLVVINRRGNLEGAVREIREYLVRK